MDVKNARKLGVKLGKVIKFDIPIMDNMLVKPFMHLRILLDLKKPLIKGFQIKRETEKLCLHWKYENYKTSILLVVE